MIKVISRDLDGKRTYHSIPGGETFDIASDHLIVYGADRSASPLAFFASGTWLYAVNPEHVTTEDS